MGKGQWWGGIRTNYYDRGMRDEREEKKEERDSEFEGSHQKGSGDRWLSS